MSKYLTANEVCEMLSIHRTTLYKMTSAGKIPSYDLTTYSDGRKMRRYKLADIEQMLLPKIERPKRRKVNPNFKRK